jgi:hypothetical protein
VRVRLWRTAKANDCRAFLCWRTAKAVTRRLAPAPSVAFFAVRHEKTHGKDSLPCVVRRGARQRGFTVQNATVCPLLCASTKNARQRVCRAFLDLCRAPAAHGKPTLSRSDSHHFFSFHRSLFVGQRTGGVLPPREFPESASVGVRPPRALPQWHESRLFHAAFTFPNRTSEPVFGFSKPVG